MDTFKCSNCESENSISLKYCTRCGFELQKAKIESVPETVSQAKTEKKKMSVKSLIGIVVGIVTMLAVQHFFFKNPSYDKAMMEIASELNKSCPIMIDAETRLDNAIALPNNIFQYNYTLVNMDKSDVDTISIKNYLVPTATNFVKTNPQMKVQRDQKTIINYYYKDRAGQYLFLISITPDQYL